MTTAPSENTVVVSLPVSFVVTLLKMHEAFHPRVLEVLQSSVCYDPLPQPATETSLSANANTLLPKKYYAEFLGIAVTGRTLPEIYMQIVDMMAVAAPDALEKLAGLRARKRRFVAINPESIHPGNEYLPVLQTVSGWWISKNIGKEDLKRALSALADAAELKIGQDVIFPLNLGIG
jgi:hypothetical protein